MLGARQTVNIAESFKGLADPTRLRMLNLLFHGELCGCDVQFVLQLSQSNVSRHFAYLKRAGLVLDRRDGYRVFYRLRTSESAGENGPLFDYLRGALGSDPIGIRDVKELKRAVRIGCCTLSEAPVIPARRPSRSGDRRPAVRRHAGNSAS